MSESVKKDLTSIEEKWLEQSIWRGKISKRPFTVLFLIFVPLPYIALKLTADGDDLWMFILIAVNFIHWGLITKRLRDLNRPIWQYVWYLIPVYGIIFLISELMLKPSVNNSN